MPASQDVGIFFYLCFCFVSILYMALLCVLLTLRAVYDVIGCSFLYGYWGL